MFYMTEEVYFPQRCGFTFLVIERQCLPGRAGRMADFPLGKAELSTKNGRPTTLYMNGPLRR